ncbi:hypothetical protein CYMTET_45022 [Cymbomonas tetramitiformis]|uniref:Ribosomal protein/NADH dehydrogenase domain-containing protein n=1 Tax=Cymbomonas tetramitiformis TaxID=36881 RepID=A0AAE0EZ06_9CHLO|nr:hypothetical protein CYMTET_45022 [Cymbomonas tetramitiformis]
MSAIPKTVAELRFHFCQSSAASVGIRNFIVKAYKEMKGANPNLPILVRECTGVEPKIWARYDFGREESVSVSGMDEASVKSTLDGLLKK